MAPHRKFLWMLVLLVIAFTGLGYRLVDLQVLRHEEALPEAESRTERTFPRMARRGSIFDSRRNLLAGSEFVKTVCVNPSLVGTNTFVIPVVARALAPLLRTNEAFIAACLTRTYTNTNGVALPRKSVVLKRKVPLPEWENIRATMQDLQLHPEEKSLSKKARLPFIQMRNGIVFAEAADDQQRFYPHGSLAAHVIGYATNPQSETNSLQGAELIGINGVEHMLNKALTGTHGWRETEVAKGKELALYRKPEVRAYNGHDVVLTIDAGLQHILEGELAEAMNKFNPASASGVIIRPATGEILAMANVPTFDPNFYNKAKADEMRNRVITDIYEPGSTFKIVAVAGALNEGIVTLDTMIDCERGYFHYAGKRLKDDHPLAVATVADIVARSSNIGTAKLALQMGTDTVHRYCRAFGFGEETHLGLQGEVRGILLPADRWGKLRTTRIPIGQGIAVTPLQMVMAMSAVANGGKLMRPLLINQLVDEDGKVVYQSQPTVVRQAISEEAARHLVTALKKVVSTNGTAATAIVEHYTVAGKTGTAEKPGNGGYLHGHYVGSFMGFLPADKPAICIGIVLDDLRPPLYYGGKTAGPTFRKVAERAARYLALPPEDSAGELDVPTSVAKAENSDKF